jgi:hypothetical protein
MKHVLAMAALVLIGGCAGAGPSRLAPVATRSIAIGTAATSQLTSQDATLPDTSYYQAWLFSGTAGQIVQIDMTSTEFDSYLYLNDQSGTRLASDDDSGGGRDARIIFTLPYTGTYRILADAYHRGEKGRYTLRLTSLGMATATGAATLLPGTKGEIRVGQSITGQLSLSDARLSDGSPYQAWTFIGRAGQRIQVDVMSADFDAFAIIQDGNGTRLVSDDDSGGGTNARIVYTLPYTGAYRLIANTYRPNSYGSYTISVR